MGRAWECATERRRRGERWWSKVWNGGERANSNPKRRHREEDRDVAKRRRRVEAWNSAKQERCWIDVLPGVLLCKILEKVGDVRTIYRSRLVSRFWKQNITDHSWGVLWEKEKPWVLIRGGQKHDYHIWCSDSGSMFGVPRLDLCKFPWIFFLASSQGLTLSWDTKLDLFLVANPLSNKFKLLPREDLFQQSSIPDFCVIDAHSGMYKVRNYTPTSEHCYESYSSSLSWENGKVTPESIRCQGFKGCLRDNVGSYLKQYQTDKVEVLLKRKREREWSPGEYFPRDIIVPGFNFFHNFEYNGRNMGVGAVEEGNASQVKFCVYELLVRKDTTWTWKKLGGISLGKTEVDQCYFRLAEGLVLVWPYEKASLVFAPKIFNLETLEWKELPLGYRIVAAFKPNPLARPDYVPACE